MTSLHRIHLKLMRVCTGPTVRCMTTSHQQQQQRQSKQAKQPALSPQTSKPLIHNMQGMNMLTLKEFNEQQVEELLWTALDMKALVKQQTAASMELGDLLKGRFLTFLKRKFEMVKLHKLLGGCKIGLFKTMLLNKTRSKKRYTY